MDKSIQEHIEIKNGLIEASKHGMREAIFSLRYKVYRYIQAIEPNSIEQFMDKFDESTNSFSYLYVKDNQQIGSIRACIYTEKTQWAPIPAFDIFYQEIMAELGPKVSLLESTRFIIDPNFQSSSSRHLFNLFRAIILNNKLYQPDYVVTTVIPDQVSFYSRIFQFQAISSPKFILGLNVPPSVLIAVKGKTLETITDQKKLTQILPEHITAYKQSGILQLSD